MELIFQGLDFFHKGGIVMYVLLLCSLFVLAVAVERGKYFARSDSGRAFAKEFAAYMLQARTEEALRLAQSSQGALAGILADVLGSEKSPARKNAAAYMEVQSGIAISRFRQKLYYLSVIVTMAPLLGLLGTISGMISAFSVFNVASGQSAAITGGVGEALIATAMGLCVAIISLAVHAYFSQRIENIITDMELCFSLAETAAGEFSSKAGDGL